MNADDFTFWTWTGPIHFEDAAWLAGLWLLPLVGLALLLRRPARRVLVAHLPFLEQALGARRVRPPVWRKLLEILLWIALFAAAFGLAAGPYREQAKVAPTHLILVVDDSLGTRARLANGKTVAEAVRQRARREWSEHVGSVAVMGLGAPLRPLALGSSAVAFDGSSRLSGESLVGRRDWARLAALARDLGARTRLRVVGAYGPRADELEPGLAGLDWATVAQPSAGAGIRAMEWASGQLRIEVEGAGSPRVLQLSAGEGTRWSQAWNPAKVSRFVWRPALPKDFSGSLTLRLDPADSFTADDRQSLAVPSPTVRRLWVGPGPGREAILAWGEASPTMGEVRAASLEELFSAPDDVNLIRVLCGQALERPLPPGIWWLFGSVATGVPWRLDSGDAEPAEVERISSEHAWMQGLRWREWVVRRAHRIEPLPGFEPLIVGPRGPLLGRFKRGAVRGLVCASTAALEDGSLALLPAFPLLLESAARGDLPAAPAVAARALRAGSEIELQPQEAPILETEKGERLRLRPSADGLRWILPERTGAMRVAGPEPRRLLHLGWLDHSGRPGPAAPQSVAKPDPVEVSRASARPGLVLFLVALCLAQWLLSALGSRASRALGAKA